LGNQFGQSWKADNPGVPWHIAPAPTQVNDLDNRFGQSWKDGLQCFNVRHSGMFLAGIHE
jgi:hypothetical protein